MLAFLIVLAIFLLAVFMIVYASRTRYYDDFDDTEEEIVTTTHTTTTTTTADAPQYVIEGALRKQVGDAGEWFVIDPVDGEKIYLNAADDMYRDAADKIWKLV